VPGLEIRPPGEASVRVAARRGAVVDDPEGGSLQFVQLNAGSANRACFVPPRHIVKLS